MNIIIENFKKSDMAASMLAGGVYIAATAIAMVPIGFVYCKALDKVLNKTFSKIKWKQD